MAKAQNYIGGHRIEKNLYREGEHTHTFLMGPRLKKEFKNQYGWADRLVDGWVSGWMGGWFSFEKYFHFEIHY